MDETFDERIAQYERDWSDDPGFHCQECGLVVSDGLRLIGEVRQLRQAFRDALELAERFLERDDYFGARPSDDAVSAERDRLHALLADL